MKAKAGSDFSKGGELMVDSGELPCNGWGKWVGNENLRKLPVALTEAENGTPVECGGGVVLTFIKRLV